MRFVAHLGRDDPRQAHRVGFAALLFSGLYFLSDVMEWFQGTGSPPAGSDGASPFMTVCLSIASNA